MRSSCYGIDRTGGQSVEASLDMDEGIHLRRARFPIAYTFLPTVNSEDVKFYPPEAVCAVHQAMFEMRAVPEASTRRDLTSSRDCIIGMRVRHHKGKVSVATALRASSLAR